MVVGHQGFLREGSEDCTQTTFLVGLFVHYLFIYLSYVCVGTNCSSHYLGLRIERRSSLDRDFGRDVR